jgi:hypothetical protein
MDDYIYEYRCTRPALYQDEGDPGKGNPKLRQGHYIRAVDEDEAEAIMKKQFPGEEIDVQYWKRIERFAYD